MHKERQENKNNQNNPMKEDKVGMLNSYFLTKNLILISNKTL
jgi:hypothetical protein